MYSRKASQICHEHIQKWPMSVENYCFDCLLFILKLACRLHGTRWLNMMTSSNRNIFRVTGHLCGEFTAPRWIPRTKASDASSFEVFFDLRLNKRLSKQSWGWWFETPWRPLSRHTNESPWVPKRVGRLNYIYRQREGLNWLFPRAIKTPKI